jgi:hypothetical protein
MSGGNSIFLTLRIAFRALSDLDFCLVGGFRLRTIFDGAILEVFGSDFNDSLIPATA